MAGGPGIGEFVVIIRLSMLLRTGPLRCCLAHLSFHSTGRSPAEPEPPVIAGIDPVATDASRKGRVCRGSCARIGSDSKSHRMNTDNKKEGPWCDHRGPWIAWQRLVSLRHRLPSCAVVFVSVDIPRSAVLALVDCSPVRAREFATVCLLVCAYFAVDALLLVFKP